MGHVAAIVLAGGSGSRTEQEVNKVYLPIADRPMLAYSLEAIERSTVVDRVVLVVRDLDRHRAEAVVTENGFEKPTTVIEGGPSRHESERRGIESLARDIETGGLDLVAIHDGARPFLTVDLLETVVTEALVTGGAVPGLPVEAPLYRIDHGAVHALPQDELRRVQTPQAFSARELLDAYRAAAGLGFQGVDTAETVERFTDLEVTVVPGDPRNRKVTFIEDLFAVEEHAHSWSEGRWTDD